MPQASAYSEEHGRNITLDEAHTLFFEQEEGKRKRFLFRCGDPRCRTMFQPLVVGALYDKLDLPNEKHRSPYFRAHKDHPHITNCTWIQDAESHHRMDEEKSNLETQSGSVLSDLGLVFKIKSPKPNEKNNSSEPKLPSDFNENFDDETNIEIWNKLCPRPQTSKFMASVAASYLKYTDSKRKSVPLIIDGVRNGTFYNICIPIQGFHPRYQEQQIYHGRVKITELTNVFLVKFLSKIDPAGSKENRNTPTEVKLLKRWLDENDRALAALLLEISKNHEIAQCFFYSTTPPTISNGKAQFIVTCPNHIGIVDETEIRILSP